MLLPYVAAAVVVVEQSFVAAVAVQRVAVADITSDVL